MPKVLKLSAAEKDQLIHAIDENAVEPSEVSQKVTDIISSSKDGNEAKGRNDICCEYYNMGRYRYTKTNKKSCDDILGSVVADSNCT